MHVHFSSYRPMPKQPRGQENFELHLFKRHGLVMLNSD